MQLQFISSIGFPSSTTAHQTPYFRLFQYHPSYDNLHTFGSICFVHLPPTERTKVTAQSVECIFLGYAQHQKGFVCYDPKVRRIRISQNVIFFFNSIFSKNILNRPIHLLLLTKLRFLVLNLIWCIAGDMKQHPLCTLFKIPLLHLVLNRVLPYVVLRMSPTL